MKKILLEVQVNDQDLDSLQAELNQTEQSFREVRAEAEKTSKSVDDVAGNGGAIAILDSLTGGLATRMRDAYEASTLFNVSLKGMRTALIATGIGAFVVALGAVVAYWEDIQFFISGANFELERQQRILQKQVSDNQFNLELLRAREASLKRSGVTQTEYNKMKVKELETLIEIQEKELELAENRLAQLKELRSTGGSTLESFARLGATILTSFGQTVDSFFEKIGLDTDFGSAAFVLSDSVIEGIFGSKSDLQEAIDRVNNLKLQIAGARSEIASLKDENEGLGPTRGREQVESVGGISANEAELSAQLEFQGQIQINEEEHQRILTEINERAALSRMEIAEKERQARVQAMEGVAAVGANVAAAIGEQTGIGKAFAASSALISTYLSAQKAYEATVGIPVVGPVLAPINAGAAIIAGLNSVKQILSVQVPSVPGGRSGAPAGSSFGGGGASNFPQPQFNLVGNTGINQLNDTINSQTNEPQRAYLVYDDVKTADELDKAAIRGARV